MCSPSLIALDGYHFSPGVAVLGGRRLVDSVIGHHPYFQCKVQDLATFKGGDYFFLNLTKRNVAVEMGSTKIPLKPGHSLIYQSPAAIDATSMPIRYSYYDEERKEWNVISASTVVLYGTRREICIFSWDAVYDRIDYHGITVPVMP